MTSAAGADTDDVVWCERRGPEGRIAEVVLNRPERRNALTGPLASTLADLLERLGADETVTVVLLRGAGDAFCSGLDLKEFAADPRPGWVASFGDEWRRAHRALFDLPAVVVGALQRAAVNGGAALALGCDFLVAGDEAFLQVGEVQQGMAAPMNTAWLMLRHPESVVARVALLGDRLHGPELVELGLANRSVPDDQVLDAARELADRLAGHDPAGVRRIKRALRRTGPATSAEEWFARPLEVDGLDRPIRPIAAVDR
ncbi:MAG: enoyl-CoA hydratase/isomerase family protein [Actinomycetota bacterium]